MQRFDVFGVPLHEMSEDELYARLLDSRGLIVTPNPEILLAARQEEQYRHILQSAVLALPDGIATEFAVAALYGHRGLRRHPGVDVVPLVAEIASRQGEVLLIIGGYAQDHETIAAHLQKRLPTLQVRCFDPGVLPDDTSTLPAAVLEEVRSLKPCVALVALGQGKGRAQGKQERIAKYLLESCPNVRIAMGVGGSMDVLSGRVDRGPEAFRRLGLEWLWRLKRDPWRFPRIFRAVIVFPLCVAWDTLRFKRFGRACFWVLKDLIAHFTRPSV